MANSIQHTRAAAHAAANEARRRRGNVKQDLLNPLSASDEAHISLGKPLPPLSEDECNRICIVPFYIVPAVDKRLALSAEGSLVFLTLLSDDENDEASEEEKEDIRRYVPSSVHQKWCFTYSGEIVLCCDHPQKLVARHKGGGKMELVLEPYKRNTAPPPKQGERGKVLSVGSRWVLRSESQTLSTVLELSGQELLIKSAEGEEIKPQKICLYLQVGNPLPEGPYREVKVHEQTRDISQQWYIKR